MQATNLKHVDILFPYFVSDTTAGWSLVNSYIFPKLFCNMCFLKLDLRVFILKTYGLFLCKTDLWIYHKISGKLNLLNKITFTSSFALVLYSSLSHYLVFPLPFTNNYLMLSTAYIISCTLSISPWPVYYYPCLQMGLLKFRDLIAAFSRSPR